MCCERLLTRDTHLHLCCVCAGLVCGRYAGMLAVAKCGGPHIEFYPGRTDSAVFDAAERLPAPTEPLHHTVGAWRSFVRRHGRSWVMQHAPTGVMCYRSAGGRLRCCLACPGLKFVVCRSHTSGRTASQTLVSAKLPFAQHSHSRKQCSQPE